MNDSICVKINNLTKTMLNVKALSGITDFYEASLVHAVIGPDGAGKTTLMRVFAGLLKPDEGSVSYLSKDLKPITSPKNYIAYFPQEPSLYPDLTCQEHLEFFGALYDLGSKDFKERCNTLYSATQMGEFKDRKAGKLSGGMYKKLGIMCVLLNKPKLLLLDELTVAVDPVSRCELWNLIYGFAKDNTTVIMTTSYPDETKKADKVHILDSGKLLTA